jgi:hypothetical protein
MHTWVYISLHCTVHCFRSTGVPDTNTLSTSLQEWIQPVQIIKSIKLQLNKSCRELYYEYLSGISDNWHLIRTP